jgi:hypothetical protein
MEPDNILADNMVISRPILGGSRGWGERLAGLLSLGVLAEDVDAV